MPASQPGSHIFFSPFFLLPVLLTAGFFPLSRKTSEARIKALLFPSFSLSVKTPKKGCVKDGGGQGFVHCVAGMLQTRQTTHAGRCRLRTSIEEVEKRPN